MIGFLGKTVKFIITAIFEVLLGILKWILKKIIQLIIIAAIISFLANYLIKSIEPKIIQPLNVEAIMQIGGLVDGK